MFLSNAFWHVLLCTYATTFRVSNCTTKTNTQKERTKRDRENSLQNFPEVCKVRKDEEKSHRKRITSHSQQTHRLHTSKDSQKFGKQHKWIFQAAADNICIPEEHMGKQKVIYNIANLTKLKKGNSRQLVWHCLVWQKPHLMHAGMHKGKLTPRNT